MSHDARLSEYARILVEDCVDVQAGWQVLVRSQPLGRPLVEEVLRAIARRRAYALLRLSFQAPFDTAWLKEAPLELVGQFPPIEAHALDSADCSIAILAPENTRAGSDVSPERLGLLQQASRPHAEPYMADRKPWVGCQYPTDALAQDAGMTLEQFTEFLYGAVLIDWDALEQKMHGIAERFDQAEEVRIVGQETDLTFSLAGRKGKVSGASANMPSGEVFYSPVEDSAEGVVHFGDYPACYIGHQVGGVRLRFEGGRIVEASAESDEGFLLETLDADEGARRLGEFGIGCNPGIQRHIRNTLFDEKIEGTVHLAVGNGWSAIGGENKSAIHWDMVKDLRPGGQIYLDGELVQENGQWLTPA